MRTLRLLTVGPVALALAGVASAQFDGPAPLAWRWVQPTNAAATGAPLVNGDTIYTAIGGRIFALDRASGNLKWRYPQVEPVPGTFRSAPVLVNGVLIASADNKTVYAVDPQTGVSKWTYNSPSAAVGQPVGVDKFVVYATTDNKLIALEADTGKAAWAQPYNIFDGIVGQISSYGGGVVYFTGRGSKQLQSLDVVTQKPNYRRPVVFNELPPGAAPVLYGDTFYVTTGLYLVAVNASTGFVRWQKNTNLILSQAPAVSVNGVFVVSQDGEALVLDPNSGNPLPSMKKGPVRLGSLPAVRPSAVGTKFVIPTANGAVNLFDPTTGSLVWSYVVRPIGQVFSSTGSSPSNGGGRGPGGGPGLGAGTQTQGRQITSLQASGPAVLAGQTLLVPAIDGSILAFDKDLGVDLTPPTVKQLWPTPGDVVNLRELIFRLEDEAAGVNETTLAVEVDGKASNYAYTRDGFLRVTFSTLATAPTATNPARATLPGESPRSNPSLQDGRHTITITAVDWLGNVSKTDYSVVVDNALPPQAAPGATQPNTGPGVPGGMGGRGGSGDGR